jgi:zinc protease
MSYLEGLSFAQIAGPLPERRILPNGLEVLYYHRPGIGLCTVQAWVRSGSIHEGRWEGSGISHYLEHMVFKGTGRFSNRELTEAVHRSGGYANAYTTFDRTVYHVDAPEEGFETAMEAVSDMVFDPLITDADAKMEREVILREIAMRDDEHDSVLAEAVLAEAIRSQPLRHPVIGHRELFVRLRPDDLRAYHAGRYVTTNVVLALGGSMEPEAAFAAAERWFGRFERRPILAVEPTAELPQAGVRRVDLRREVSTAKGVACWSVPGLFDRGRLAMDLFLGVLGSGNSSLLWDELREKRKLVHSIDASAFGVREMGLAWFGWAGEAGADAPTVERAMREVVDGLLQRGVTPAEFAKVRRQAVVSMVNGQKNIHGLVGRGAYAACVGHDIHWTHLGVGQLATLGAEDLATEARRWLRPEAVTYGTLRGLEAKVAVGVTRRAPAAPEPFEVRVLDNGVRVVLQPDDAIPKAGIGVFLAAGTAYERAETRGTTGLFATLLARDTVHRTKEEVADAVDRMGATFADVGSQISCGLWGEALSSDFGRLAGLVADGILCPKFVPATVALERAAVITACKDAEDDIVEQARLRLLRQYFGEHPLGVDTLGTPETLARIQPADLGRAHQEWIVAGNLVVGISGAFDRSQALDLVQARFGSLPKVAFATRRLERHPPRPARAVVERAQGEQAVVAIAFPHCGFGPDEVVAASITEELLSGMASGLFRRVREEKGMAYFVGANRVETVDQGMFYLYAGTAPAMAEAVVVEMEAELARLRRGAFQGDEIDAAKRRMRVARRQSRQSAGARMQGALIREVAGLGANFDAEWERRMNLTDAKAVQAFARRYLDARFAQQLIVLPTKA